MNTHELANTLAVLAKMLKATRTIELREWADARPTTPENGDADSAAIAQCLSAMATFLSQVSKPQWMKLIKDWDIPVAMKTSDSARDLVGRLFQYLKDHPEAWRKLHGKKPTKDRKVSAELMETLSILLGSRDKAEAQ